MHFGTSTLFFQEYSVVEALDHILDSGFSAAEIWMEHLWKTRESPEHIAEYACKLGMELRLHSASYDVNITSTNPGIRKESLRQVEQSIITGKRLGTKVIVVHPGHLSSSKEDVDSCWVRLEEAFSLIDQWACRENVVVGIEAMEKRPKEIYMLPEHIERMLGMGWSNLGVTLDIAHTFTHDKPVEYIKKLKKDWITHVHLSDGSRKVTHLPLGQGEIDIPAALQTLQQRYDGLVIIEGCVPLHGQETVRSNQAYLQGQGLIYRRSDN